MVSRRHFAKYEGIGNDFILVDAEDESEVPPALAARLCDRHVGVGGDGLLLLLPPRRPDCAVRMRVLNADGSVPEMCGNGVRCVALHVARRRGTEGRNRADAGSADGPDMTEARTVRVDTDAGVRACVVDERAGGGGAAMVAVAMGTVRVLGDRALDLGGRRVSVVTADAGNPHAVLFGAFARGDVEELGPRIATHPDFPRGTNAEFAHVVDGRIELWVWERGVGITLACGTGACAATAVARERGLVPTGVAVPVRLPGGTLEVTVSAAGEVTLRGPARHVFSGELSGDPGPGLV